MQMTASCKLDKPKVCRRCPGCWARPVSYKKKNKRLIMTTNKSGRSYEREGSRHPIAHLNRPTLIGVH
jgi:hypothetical protein